MEDTFLRYSCLILWVVSGGANWNPKFRNFEIARIPIRYWYGHQLILSDNFGQTQLPSNVLGKKTGNFNADCL